MNTSRGRNEEHSKKMGQFDRVAFKQCGETLFDELFEFDRQLKDTMAYANTQKNGSLNERLEMNAMELSEPNPYGTNEQKSIAEQTAGIEYSQNSFMAPLTIDIRDDVDDEAVYGRNRHSKKPSGGISR